MAKKRITAIFQLRVSLREIEPPVWRSIQLSEDTTLARLHRILQLLFNWEDYHLHDFKAGGCTFSVPNPEDAFYGREVIDERLVPLNQVVDRVGDAFEYVYDFGDDWIHDILLEAILLPSPDVLYPRCIAGARNGPPEDSGGPYTYSDDQRMLADPENAEDEEKLAWYGDFDPEAFSVDAINASLNKTFHRRAAAKKTRG